MAMMLWPLLAAVAAEASRWSGAAVVVAAAGWRSSAAVGAVVAVAPEVVLRPAARAVPRMVLPHKAVSNSTMFALPFLGEQGEPDPLKSVRPASLQKGVRDRE